MEAEESQEAPNRGLSEQEASRKKDLWNLLEGEGGNAATLDEYLTLYGKEIEGNDSEDLLDERTALANYLYEVRTGPVEGKILFAQKEGVARVEAAKIATKLNDKEARKRNLKAARGWVITTSNIINDDLGVTRVDPPPSSPQA